MIKATELRIGNWVHTQHRKMVKGLHEPIQLKVVTPQEEHKWEPIPLSAEWLERMGFDQINELQHNEYEHEKYYIMSQGDNHYSCSEVTEMYGGSPVKYWRFRWNHDIAYISYTLQSIHQLQNLYFALTGEELKLKDQ